MVYTIIVFLAWNSTRILSPKLTLSVSILCQLARKREGYFNRGDDSSAGSDTDRAANASRTEAAVFLEKEY